MADHPAMGDTTHQPSINIYTAAGVTGAYYAASLFVLSETWYKDREYVPFHFYNDNRAYLQVDKMGHVFGSYVYSYIGFHLLRESGFSREQSLLYGATLGLVLQTPVEIMDGIHEGYGFSWGDMAANAAGSALVLLQEVLFREQLVTYKFSYRESDYAGKANGYLGTNTFDRVFNDYNGHTYWLSCPINKIVPNTITPDWLNIAVGYGANGMYGEFTNRSEYNGVTIPPATRYRQYLLSLDIDWSRIETDSSILNIILKALTFIKLPFPALEYTSEGVLKGHYLYF
ncbi:YfiM family protein [bacterium]|nr:YfiM family protein [bacterium]